MAGLQVPIFGSAFKGRFKYPSQLPPVTDTTSLVWVNGILGGPQTAWWNFQEVSGNAIDKTGNGNDLTPGVSGGTRTTGQLGITCGQNAKNLDGWKALTSVALEVGANQFALAGIMEIPQTPDSIYTLMGKVAVPVAANIGWDVLTTSDGRMQCDVWDSSGQHAASVQTRSHAGIGPFPFLCGRTLSGGQYFTHMLTPFGGAVSSGYAIADITNSNKFSFPGYAGAVGPSFGLNMYWGALYIGAVADAVFANRSFAMLQRLMGGY